jgi:hypothetical protein
MAQFLCVAARTGDTSLALYAMESWAFQTGKMLLTAAKYGKIEMAKLALEWNHGRNLEDMLIIGTSAGHGDIVEMAYRALNSIHGRLHTNLFNHMLYEAALWEKLPLVWKAVEWGANDLNLLLMLGSYPDTEHLLFIARKLKERYPACTIDYNVLLRQAALKDNINAARLAKKWGATDFDDMLVAAASAGRVRMAHLALKWGAQITKKMLEAATDGYQERVRTLASLTNVTPEQMANSDNFGERGGNSMMLQLTFK